MPTYDYRCQACGHTFELFQSMSERVKRKCPSCAKPRLERLIGTGAAVLFKGSGFYETDYRSSSYKAGAEAEKKSGESQSDGKQADGKAEGKHADGKQSRGGAKDGSAPARSDKPKKTDGGKAD